jgi:hypothetical protein
MGLTDCRWAARHSPFASRAEPDTAQPGTARSTDIVLVAWISVAAAHSTSRSASARHMHWASYRMQAMMQCKYAGPYAAYTMDKVRIWY